VNDTFIQFEKHRLRDRAKTGSAPDICFEIVSQCDKIMDHDVSMLHVLPQHRTDSPIDATDSIDGICNSTLGCVFEAARRISCSIGGWFEVAFHVISLLLVAACRPQARKTRGREQRELLKIDRSSRGSSVPRATYRSLRVSSCRRWGTASRRY
jgi:hypothetical protein